MKQLPLTLAFASLCAAGVLFSACGDEGSASSPLTDAGVSDAAVKADAVSSDVAVPVDAIADGASPREPVRILPQALSVDGHDRFYNVAHDPQGRILALAQVCPGTLATDDCATALVRFTADGARDTTFGVNGVATVNAVVGGSGEVPRGLVVAADGKIVVAGVAEQSGATDARERDVYLARFDVAGRIDPTFGSQGVARFDLAPGKLVGTTFKTDGQWGLAADGQGRLYVSGAALARGRDDTDFVVLRVTPTGLRDVSFGVDGMVNVDVSNFDATPKQVVVDATGRVLVGGYFTNPTTTVVSPILFRLTAGGALDATFGAAGVWTEEVLPAAAEIYAFAQQGDAIVTAGYGRPNTNVEVDFLAMRVTGAGALDPSFGTGGYRLVDFAANRDTARTMALLPSGRILLAGSGRKNATDQDAMFAMLSPQGARIPEFGNNGVLTRDLGGVSDALWGISVGPGGAWAAAVGAISGVALPGNDAGVADDDAVLLVLALQ